MNTQDQLSVLFLVLLAVQIACSILSFKSKKSIGKYTGLLNVAIMFPIIGNLIILRASNEAVSEIGYYTSYIGMTLILMAITGNMPLEMVIPYHRALFLALSLSKLTP